MTRKNPKPAASQARERPEDNLSKRYARLLGYLRSKVPEQDAHDIAQECLVVLVEKRSEIVNLDAFMFKVASNKIKQFYDRNARRAGIVGVLLSFDELPVATLSTRLSIRVARENDLAKAMQRLPLRQYQAFELRYVEGLEIAAAADVLGVSPATLKRDIERARASLVDTLGPAQKLPVRNAPLCAMMALLFVGRVRPVHSLLAPRPHGAARHLANR